MNKKAEELKAAQEKEKAAAVAAATSDENEPDSTQLVDNEIEEE